MLKNGSYVRVDQTNNSYVFPGVGLGAIAVRARRISDGMLMEAARALADASPARLDPNANLLPPVSDLREVSFQVARAVALQARDEGLADVTSPEDIEAKIRAKMWDPVYRPYRRIRRQVP